MQVEDVRDAVGENAERPAGHRIGVAGRRIAETQIAVIGRGTADVDTRRSAGELAGRDARILNGMPDEFEQQSLLRIHLRRFARRDPEKRRFEQIDAGQQPGGPGIAFARLRLVRVVIETRGPALRVDFGNRIGTRQQQLPKRLQIGGAWKPAGGANDRYQLVTHSAEANPVPW